MSAWFFSTRDARWFARLVIVAGSVISAFAGPGNDSFNGATRIAGVTNFTISNAGATVEVGEPSHAGEAPSATLWWQWTAPYTGSFRIVTSNSVVSAQTPLDTVVAVYTGSSFSTLRSVVANDDTEFGEFGALWSRVVFRAYEGEVFRIAVGSLGNTGTIRMDIGPGGPVMAPWVVPGLDGQPVYSTNFLGKTVMIDFWETTCTACIEELADLVRIQDTFRPQGFTFLGLSGDPEVKLVLDYLVTRPMNYPIAMSTPTVQRLLNGAEVGYPTKFLIDPEGRVVGTYEGGNTFKFYRSVVDPLVRSDSRPRLRVEPVATGVKISWQAELGAYSLQEGRSPAGPWNPIGVERVFAGPDVSVTVPATNVNSYFRVVGR